MATFNFYFRIPRSDNICRYMSALLPQLEAVLSRESDEQAAKLRELVRMIALHIKQYKRTLCI